MEEKYVCFVNLDYELAATVDLNHPLKKEEDLEPFKKELDDLVGFDCLRDKRKLNNEMYKLQNLTLEKRGCFVEYNKKYIIIAAPITNNINFTNKHTRRNGHGIGIYVRKIEATDLKILEELRSAFAAYEELTIREVDTDYDWHTFKTDASKALEMTNNDHGESVTCLDLIPGDEKIVCDYSDIGDNTKLSLEKSFTAYIGNSGLIPPQYDNDCNLIITDKKKYEEIKRRNMNVSGHAPTPIPKNKNLLRRFLKI